jgi:two-component system sensor histidine kinase KdpD
VSNLVDMTRIESGAIHPKKEWVPLEEIVGVALARLESRLRAHEVRVSIPDDLPLVSVDPVLLEQVFINLLDNAVKYTPATTPIEVDAHRNDALVVEVRDRGPGLPAGQESAVFDRFFRHGTSGGGLGLGLSICKGIVEVHGGSIEAAQREGGGAVFRMELPLAEAPPVAPEPPVLQHVPSERL